MEEGGRGGQPHNGKDVSEGTTRIHISVIVIAVGFVTIATIGMRVRVRCLEPLHLSGVEVQELL